MAQPHSLLDEERISLCEVLDRVLNKGVVVAGEVIISVADIDLIYLGLRLVLTSAETARQFGPPSEPIPQSLKRQAPPPFPL